MKYIKPNWPAPTNIKAYTTLKTGWGGDDHTSQQLSTLLALPNEPIWVTQTHSAIALPAVPENKDKIADATFTNQPHQVCVVVTADCLPILICNKKGTYVAAVHAGWRGLASGIIDTTLAALQLPAEEVLVWFGPAIGPQKFEVGKDVYDAFIQKQPEAQCAFKPYKHLKWLANLYTLAHLRLKQYGIANIYGGTFCTYTQEDMFFSYRRDKGLTGRMASLIWIDK